TSGSPLVALPSAAVRPCQAVPANEACGGLEREVIEGLLRGDLPGGLLLEAIADHCAAALQRSPEAAVGVSAAELRGLAARVSTGLAVALLQSDLSERIAARLAAEAPFAEGWRSCPE
ncbi:MAG: hypothetical protein ACKOPS_17280, partial [Cyanobium sp.]